VKKFFPPPKNANIVVSGLKRARNVKEQPGMKKEPQMLVVLIKVSSRKNMMILLLAVAGL